MNWVVTVEIWIQPGRLDPEGKAIHAGLRQLDYDGVEDVRAGRVYSLKLNGSSREDVEKQVEAMCDDLLANPVIETYDIRVRPEQVS